MDSLEKIRSSFKQVAADSGSKALPIVHRKAENQISETSGVHSLTRDPERIFEKKKQRMANVQRIRAASLNPLATDFEA